MNKSENPPTLHDPGHSEDPFALARFMAAQEREDVCGDALSEIKRGQKETHWMWFIFPQFMGLGFSETSKRYAIRSLAEARAYLSHPVLGARLRECAEAALAVEGRTAFKIFGSPDDKKLQSSMTLFARADGPGSVFVSVLEKYFGGREDAETLRRLEEQAKAAKHQEN